MQAKSRQIVGSSSWAEALRQQIASVARRPSTVLITGPSGTGKELVARAIHEQSDRADKPFIPIDCASVTGTLFASHMFGHVKGAFTGATSDTLGCFRAAEGGTVFLDENRNSVFDEGEAGVAGVAVSNGLEVVVTGDDGTYALPAYDDMNLFITKPFANAELVAAVEKLSAGEPG